MASMRRWSTVWGSGSFGGPERGANEDVKQLKLLGADTSSAEVVFAPAERKMETLNALFGLIDGIELR